MACYGYNVKGKMGCNHATRDAKHVLLVTWKT